jgi:hypothetical protein
MLGRYKKFWYALMAGLVVAVPALTAASQDNNISLQEWLTTLGLFLPAVVVALSPANKQSTGDIVDAVNADPNIQLEVKATRAPTTGRYFD